MQHPMNQLVARQSETICHLTSDWQALASSLCFWRALIIKKLIKNLIHVVDRRYMTTRNHL